jgi:hypothetical protein
VLVDTVKWVSTVEWRGEVELSMAAWVEVMKEVQVENVDWAMCPAGWTDLDWWIDS